MLLANLTNRNEGGMRAFDCHRRLECRSADHNHPPSTILLQTAGLAVLLKAREISRMGVILLLTVLLLLVLARVAARMADARNKLDRQLAGKTDAHYISTGEVGGQVLM